MPEKSKRYEWMVSEREGNNIYYKIREWGVILKKLEIGREKKRHEKVNEKNYDNESFWFDSIESGTMEELLLSRENYFAVD